MPRDTHTVDQLDDIISDAAKLAADEVIRRIGVDNLDIATAGFEARHKRIHPSATEANIRKAYLFGLIEEIIQDQTTRYRGECKSDDRFAGYRDSNAEHRLLKSELV